MIKFLTFFSVIFIFTSCTSVNKYAKYSSGQIGCSPSEIQISDEPGFVSIGLPTWTATCKGNTYYCSSSGESSVSCKEAN